jgi:pimeloyl-ACP methyl ester carboxylesterase
MARRSTILKRSLQVVLVVVVVLAAGIAYLLRDPSPVGYWRSAQGQQAYAQAYGEALAAMPAPTQTRDVRTSFGYVRVLQFAGQAQDPAAVPAFFIPGRASGAPMWSQNLPAVAAQRPVYVVDPLGDAGNSVQTRELTGPADQGAWLEETLTALDLPRVHLVGHSFGGWTAANYALRHPERVQSLALLESVLTFTGLKWQFVLSTIPASLGFGGPGGAEAAADQDPVAAMIAAGGEHYAAKLPFPAQLSEADLRRLTMPAFVGLGGRSEVVDAAEAEATARRVLPAATVRVWPDATHSLPMEEAAEVTTALVDLMAASEPA